MMQELPREGVETPAAPPYKFLNYFEESDHDRFAGRDDEVQEALAGLTRGRTYVLFGRSGLGKTSLLLAGLFPRLRERGYHPLRVRLLESPVEDFCAALAAELHCPELARPMPRGERQQRIPHLLEELSAREPLVIVLDQFEEFFVRFRERPEERAEFEALLGHIHQEHGANIRLVFSLREDYYAELEDLREELPELTDYKMRLQPLTAYGARQAIVRPLQHAHVTYEEAFVNRLVDLLADWAFAPPVLQIVCTELYRDVVARRGLPVHLTRDDLERLGGVDGIFRGYVHRVTSGLAEERVLLVRVVLDALISSERTRYALRVEDLLSGPVRADYGELRAVLDHLTEQGLLRVEHRKDERWYELLHEHLMSIVESWLSSDVDFVRFRTTRDFVASLTEDPRWRTKPEWLITAPQLQERVDPWKERLRLGADTVEFLLRSSIHGQADSVAYWAARFDDFGAERSGRLMLELLAHPDPQVRRGAAASCGQLPDPAGQLGARSLELALADPDEDVRRAAGRSFLRLAGPKELAALRAALEVPERKALALELLADRLEARRSVEGIPDKEVRHAGSLVRARRLERDKPLIRSRMLTGAEVGAVSALAWGLTLGSCAAAYWLWTIYPEQVTVRWPAVFLQQLLWLIIDNIPFVIAPWGLILGWRLSRRVARTAAALGREDWFSSVNRSGTVAISCVLVYLILVITLPVILEEQAELARQTGLSRGVIFFSAVALAAAVTWLTTVALVWLGTRCIRPDSRWTAIVVFAALTGNVFPYALDTLLTLGVAGAGVRPEALYRVVVRTLACAAFASSYQTSFIICVLAAERARRSAPAPSATRAARGVVLVGSLLGCLFFFGIHELRSLPGMRAARPFTETATVEGRIWQQGWDVEYFFFRAPFHEPFALSVQEEHASRTRLYINGQEVTPGMLLVSPWARLSVAVASRPGADVPGLSPAAAEAGGDYRFVLRREPLLAEAPAELSPDRWTLVRLPLERVEGKAGAAPSWRARLEGRLPPSAPGRRVNVQPVLADIVGLAPGACLGISSVSGTGAMDSYVLTNRANLGALPSPGLAAGRFFDGLRIAPAAGGSWSAELSLTQLVDFQPRECERPEEEGLSPLAPSEAPAPDLYGALPSLLVAVTLD